MKFEVTGSPILARQNPAVYWFIVITLGVIAFIFLIAFVSKKLGDYFKSSEYQLAHKSAVTTKKNIKSLKKKANLTEKEASILWHACKINQAPNITYLYKDEQAMDKIFKSQYHEMKKNGASEEQIRCLFHLVHKIERERNSQITIRSSNSLKPGQELVYKDSQGFNWILTLEKQENYGIFLEIPKLLSNSQQKPAPLSRFILTVTANGNLAYTMQTRAIRYDQSLDGKNLLLIKNQNSLEPMQRRKYRRSDFEAPVFLVEVEQRASMNGSSKTYASLGQRIDGTFENISVAGCSVRIKKEIPDGRYLQLSFSLNGKEHTVVGIILNTEKNQGDNSTSCHIKFTDAQRSTKNEISAYVYGFND